MKKFWFIYLLKYYFLFFKKSCQIFRISSVVNLPHLSNQRSMSIWMVTNNSFVTFGIAFVNVHFFISVVRVLRVIDGYWTFVVFYFGGLVWLSLLILSDFNFKDIGVVYFIFAFRWIGNILQSIYSLSYSQYLLNSRHPSKIGISLITNTTANLIKAGHIIFFKRLQLESIGRFNLLWSLNILNFWII